GLHAGGSVEGLVLADQRFDDVAVLNPEYLEEKGIVVSVEPLFVQVARIFHGGFDRLWCIALQETRHGLHLQVEQLFLAPEFQYWKLEHFIPRARTPPGAL